MDSPRNHRPTMTPFNRKNKQPASTLFHIRNWLKRV